MSERQDAMRTPDVVTKLRQACAAAGGQTAWARHHGLSPAHIHDVLHGRRDPGKAVLRPLGLQRAETTYVPLEPQEIAIHDQDGITLVTAWAD